MRAARNGYLACVEILLEAKADIHHKNDKGDTALTNANYLCIGRHISAGALPGNTIKDSPASLLKEMENIDFRDKHTLVAIKKLLKYYKQSLTDEQLKQAEDHLQKRTELYDLHKTNVYQALDLGMEITMPIVLLDLIMEYHPITEINFNQDLFFFSKGENSSNDKAELKLRK